MGVTAKFYIEERKREILDNLHSGMDWAVLIVENQAKRNVTKTGSEHPQVQTGELRSSIASKVNEVGDKIIGEVGTNVEYGPYLEFGTPRMPAYPWLFPALEMKRKAVVSALRGKAFSIL